MKKVCIVAFTLVIIGAINTLYVGIMGFNAIEFLFGKATFLTRLIYTLIGTAGTFIPSFIFIYKPFKGISK